MRVSLAILQKDGKIFIQRRHFEPDEDIFWEFPGGKIEENETSEEAIKRELKEELSLEALEYSFFGTFGDEKVSLECFLITKWKGEIQLLCAEEAFFAEKSELKNFKFLPANKSLTKALS